MLSDFELTMLIIGIVIYFVVAIIVCIYYGMKKYHGIKRDGFWHRSSYRIRATIFFFVFGIILFAIIGAITVLFG